MRTFVVGVVLAFVLAGVAIAEDRAPEESRTLTGPAGGTGSVTVDVSVKERRHGRFRFYDVKFEDLPMQCEGGPSAFDFDGGSTGTRASARGADSFGVGVVAKNRRGDRTYSWYYEGELTSRDTAAGTVRAAGTRMPLEGGGKDNCRTGRLVWTASLAE